MGSESVSGLVFFIAAMLVAALAAGAMSRVVGTMASELRERGDGLAAAMGAGVAIVNDPQTVPYNGATDELRVFVKNVGTEWLIDEELTVFVNGAPQAFTPTLLEGATSWSPGTVLEAEVVIVLAAGDHRLHVTYLPNIADDLQFRI